MLIFKQKNRIKSKYHFNYLFNNSTKVNCNGFICFLSKSLTDSPKYAFVASKKIGNAVQRNRAKRVMRDIVRLNQFNIDKQFDMVVIAKTSFFKYDFNELEIHFKQKLSKY